MGEIKLEFISEGFKEILESDGVKTAVENAANEIAKRADNYVDSDSDGFRAHTWMSNIGGGRWAGSVWTTDYKSMAAEAENKALSKAVMK